MVPCGWREGVSLRAHIKSHKSRNKSVTVEMYRKRFKKANLGPPAYSPPKEQVEKFMNANPHLAGKKAEVTEAPDGSKQVNVTEDDAPQTTATDEEIQRRFNVLFKLVNNDPTAESFCLQAARDEARLKDLNAQLDALVKLPAKHEGKKNIGSIRQAISDTTESLRDIFKHLDLTVAQRRKANQLGDTSTVAQLMSNYVNTRRKWSIDRNQIFDSQIADWRLRADERIQRRVINEVPELPGESKHKKGDLTNDSDLRTAIHEIGDSIRI